MVQRDQQDLLRCGYDKWRPAVGKLKLRNRHHKWNGQPQGPSVLGTHRVLIRQDWLGKAEAACNHRQPFLCPDMEQGTSGGAMKAALCFVPLRRVRCGY